jgi:hypothetical protein
MCYWTTGKLKVILLHLLSFHTFIEKNMLNSCKGREILNKYSAIHLNTLCSKTMEQHALDTNAGK